VNSKEISNQIQNLLPSKAELSDWLAEEFGPKADTDAIANDLWAYLFNYAAKRMV
jgi:hypothetical protein